MICIIQPCQLDFDKEQIALLFFLGRGGGAVGRGNYEVIYKADELY